MEKHDLLQLYDWTFHLLCRLGGTRFIIINWWVSSNLQKPEKCCWHLLRERVPADSLARRWCHPGRCHSLDSGRLCPRRPPESLRRRSAGSPSSASSCPDLWSGSAVGEERRGYSSTRWGCRCHRQTCESRNASAAEEEEESAAWVTHGVHILLLEENKDK